MSSYKINPNVIPRPNQFDQVYRSVRKDVIFNTDEDTLPPHSTAYYNVHQTHNSSCRYVRPTLTRLPCDQSFLNNSSVIYGLHFQPFAEHLDFEDEVPKVEGIFIF